MTLAPMKMAGLVASRKATPQALVDIRADFAIDEAHKYIREQLESGKPFLAARLGSVELEATRAFYFRSQKLLTRMSLYADYGEAPWRNSGLIDKLSNNAGVFPPTADTVEKFCQVILESMPEIDLLGSWRPDEFFFDGLLKSAKICQLSDLEPYRGSYPWTSSLVGRRVCVVHPFAKTIEAQFKRRTKLFENDLVLPEFELVTLEAVQSIANNKTDFLNWFDALDWMERESLRIGFDVAIVGCGAYGLPLAARLKRAGKQAIHLGAGTQILFGIKGRRWDEHGVISKLYNDYWVRPSESEKPIGAERVEGACYW